MEQIRSMLMLVMSLFPAYILVNFCRHDDVCFYSRKHIYIMITLYPAIDLKDGQAVRLLQGDFDKLTVYAPDPGAQAKIC